jgi:hypothetical protein
VILDPQPAPELNATVLAGAFLSMLLKDLAQWIDLTFRKHRMDRVVNVVDPAKVEALLLVLSVLRDCFNLGNHLAYLAVNLLARHRYYLVIEFQKTSSRYAPRVYILPNPPQSWRPFREFILNSSSAIETP